MNGSFFHGLVSGLHQGISDVRKQNALDAENEIKGEQDILTHIAKTTENPEIAQTAISALLKIHQSGKPTGFLGKLVGKRGENPDLAGLIASAHPAHPTNTQQDSQAAQAAPPAPEGVITQPPAPSPEDTATFVPTPPSPDITSAPPSVPLPSSPAGPAATPINTTKQESQINLGGANTGAAPAAAPQAFTPPAPAMSAPPPAPQNTLSAGPPAPGGYPGYGIPTPLAIFAAQEKIRGQRQSTSTAVTLANNIAELEAKKAELGAAFPPEAEAKLKTYKEAAKTSWSARDEAAAQSKEDIAAGQNASREKIAKEKPNTQSLLIRADEAKAVGDITSYNRIMNTMKEAAEFTKRANSLSGISALYNDIDPKAIAEGIKAGRISPIITDLGRPTAAAVTSILSKDGVDVTKKQSEWKSVQRFYLTKQGPQQLRIRQSMDVVMQAADKIDELADQWDAGGFKTLNKANMIAAQHGLYGPEAAKLATQLEAQITDSVEGMASVFMGGNAPTDKAMSLAQSQLRGDWSKDVLKSATKLVRQNIGFRAKAIDEIGPSGISPDSPYLINSAPPSPTTKAPAPDAALEAFYKANPSLRPVK